MYVPSLASVGGYVALKRDRWKNCRRRGTGSEGGVEVAYGGGYSTWLARSKHGCVRAVK